MRHRVVWKHHLGVDANVLPGHRVVSIGIDWDRAEPLPTAWVEKFTDDDESRVLLDVYGTGHPISDETAVPVGSTVHHEFGWVWHVYQSTRTVYR